MKNNRKEFLKQIGLAGLGLSSAGKLIGAYQPDGKTALWQGNRQRFNMHGYAAPALDTVRIGLIGIGARGTGNVMRMAAIEGVEIKALCDVIPERVETAIDLIKDYEHHYPDSYTDGPDAWKHLCERDDIDLVVIGTPWYLHASQAIFSMEHDKHVMVEIPVAETIEECWQVVETSERTRKHCIQASMSCHDGAHAVTLNMVRKGFFGELIHGEGNYVHDRVSDISRWERDEHNSFGYRPWRLDANIGRHGNLYPQHGLGPLAQMMDINYGDQMDYMVSMSGNDFTMGGLMEELAAEDDYYKPYVGKDFRGNMNVTIIRTHKGRTMMLQHDISSPRPGSRFQLISGTKGITRHNRYESQPVRIATSHDGWLSQEEYTALAEKYTPNITRRFREMQQGRREINREGRSYSNVYVIDWRLIDCLRNGLPLEMDVYDAVTWSCIIPLSEWSVANRSNSVDVPDFTSGAWKTNERGMDLDLRKGGGTTRLL